MAQSKLAFVADTLLTPHARVSPALLRVDDGKVASIERASGVATDAVEIAGTVIPGLVDLQVNGWGKRDVLEGTVDAIEGIAESLLEEGVTAWLPTIVSSPAPARLDAIDAVAEAMKSTDAGARILGVHLEGPWISSVRAGAHDLDALEVPNASSISESLGRRPGVVRIVTLASELPGGVEAVRQVVGSGAVASIGHTDASFDEAIAAVDAGARMATHLYNAMRPLHHREPGVVAAVLADQRVVAGVIADGIHVDPSIVSLIFRAKPKRVALVSDVVAGDGSSDAARLSDGTLAGALSGLCVGIATSVRAGVTLEDAVVAATVTPADVLRSPLGRLAVGSRADFVVLDDDLRPAATYIGGRRVWGR